MASGVSTKILEMLNERKLTRIKPDRDLVVKELEGAVSDLEDAKDSLSRGKFKWTIIQAYYSMFHAARALLYGAGYREKSHRALLTALDELFVKSGRIDVVTIRRFKDAMALREEADYSLTFSESNAKAVVDDAEEFLDKIKETLKVQW